MIKKIRRLQAHKSIENYLRYFLPQIELGDLVSFKCYSFDLGDYVVETSAERYHLIFWEYISEGKKFYITLSHGNDASEIIEFSISGFFRFHIYAKSVKFATSEGTYITDLTNDGYTTLYPEEDIEVQYFVLNNLTKLPKHVDLHRLLKVSRDEWL